MTRIIIALLRGYQVISRAMGSQSLPLFISSGCRSWPTCSDYTIEAVQTYGPVRGVVQGMIRVVKCNPLFRPQAHR